VLSFQIVANQLTGFVYGEAEVSGRFLPTEVPAFLPLAYGTLPLTRAIASPPYTVAIYGSRIVAVFEGTETLAGLFDFASYEHPPSDRVSSVVVGKASLTTAAGAQTGDISTAVHTVSEDLQFALAREGTLYVQHGYNGYTKEAAGQTGYVTAIDLASGALLWRSAPQVGNTAEFVLHGGAIVSAYGFTAEPRFLYVLDASTGVVRHKVSQRASFGHLVEKDGRLYVRGYDTDYVYAIRSGRTATPSHHL
jgi:hypothetical protein